MIYDKIHFSEIHTLQRYCRWKMMHSQAWIKLACIRPVPDFWEGIHQLNPALLCVCLQSQSGIKMVFCLKCLTELHLDTWLNCRQQAHVSPASWQCKECLHRTGRNSWKRRAKDSGASHCHSWTHVSLLSRILGTSLVPLCGLFIHHHKASSYWILIARKWVNWFRQGQSSIRAICTLT